MASFTKLNILELNDDILYLILELMWASAPIPVRVACGQVPYNKGRILLPLSETCKHMREAILPWVFREVYNWPGSLWPRSLWKYFKQVFMFFGNLIADHRVG